MSASDQAWISSGAEVLAQRCTAHAGNGIDCDVLIVGSGYGGAVAAARLAGWTIPDESAAGGRRTLRVWVLERGREHVRGSFPSRFGELPGEVRFSRQDGLPPRGDAEGMFDLRLGDTVNVVLGNGLGGGSLINAGVMVRPDPSAFEAGWPAAIRLDSLKNAYLDAEAMLVPEPLPVGETPPKLASLIATVQGGGTTAARAPVAVHFGAEQANGETVTMSQCLRCGNCITGCNHGAKKTLDTNYLAHARRAGAELFCGGWVESLVRDPSDTHWLVDWHFTRTDLRPPGDRPYRLRAAKVVLAAGTLGSTEILLRSRRRGLWVSGALGTRFSTNGDQIAAVFRQNLPAHASASEDRPAHASASEDDDPVGRCVGPAITGVAKATHGTTKILVEEFAVPAPMRRILGEVTTTFGVLNRLFTDALVKPHPADEGQDDLAVTTSSLEYTALYGMMGDDGAAGRITLASPPCIPPSATDATVRLDWPRDGQDQKLWELFDAQLGWLTEACKNSVGGLVIANPLYRDLSAGIPDRRKEKATLSVHPLGGCPMAERPADGVVDADGRVFAAADGKVHPGLAVLDGAIIPTALGVNPALTIAALAERAVGNLVANWWQGNAQAPDAAALRSLPPRPWLARRIVAAAETAIRIREQLGGELQVDGRPYRATLRIETEDCADLAGLLQQKSRRLEFGTATLGLRPIDGKGAIATATLTGHLELLEPVADVDQPIKAKRLFAIYKWAQRAARGGRTDQGLADAFRHWAEQRGWQERRLVYRFTVDDPGASGLPQKLELVGTKTIAFTEAPANDAEGNPWRQLSELDLVAADPDGCHVEGRLCLDQDDLASRREALLSVRRQRDQPTALADLAALALLVGRMLLTTHLAHFVPPGDADDQSAERLPGPLPGLTLSREALPDAEGAMLTRYRAPGTRSDCNPVVLIHGLSAAGSSFAHPSIPNNLVTYLGVEQQRDVWVLELRSSSALEPRRGPFSFEQVAMGDIPRALRRVAEVTGAPKIDVVAHCIGSAMFCVAVLQDPTLHEQVGRVVLSQVGPLLRMSPFNRLRGFIASFAAQFLGVDTLDVRPGDSRLASLLDMLLASYPYPAGDAEADRADRIGARGDFRRVRHRADAIVGQTFELANVADETLLALDAIFGWVKLRTLAQTIHFAHENLLTDAEGDNRAVSPERLKERFAFPVLLLHGRRNRVFEWRGSRAAWRRLASVFGEAQDAVVADGDDLCFGKGTARQLRVLAGYGHQDTLIGRDAHRDVFAHIGEFLSAHCLPPGRAVERRARFECEPPWIGPMLGWLRTVRRDSKSVDLTLLVRPGPRHAALRCVVLVPALKDSTNGAWLPGDIDLALGFNVRNGNDAEVQRACLLEHALTLRFALDDFPLAFLVLTLHAEAGAFGADDHRALPASEAPADEPLRGFELSAAARDSVRKYLDDFGTDRPGARRYDELIFRVGPAALAARDRLRPAPTNPEVDALSFALASCQYPPSLFDKWVAGASMARLDRALSVDDAAPSFILLIGDQVYVDAVPSVVAGQVGDPRDVARRAYELNWRLPPFRRVAARLPVYTMLDDHEVADNWRPERPGQVCNPVERAGVEAFARHQSVLDPPGSDQTYTYAFAPGGWPFFVLDTRCWRERSGIDAEDGLRAVDEARIIRADDLDRLKVWLVQCRDAPAKFVVSPSVVMPFERAHLGRPIVERLGSDSWSGYPSSLLELFGFIGEQGVRGVVFLSGDAHLSMACRFDFADSDLAIHAVVSSGLHTPWPFANNRPSDHVLEGEVELPACKNMAAIHGCVSSAIVTPHAGYAALRVEVAAMGTKLTVTLCDGEGQPTMTYSL